MTGDYERSLPHLEERRSRLAAQCRQVFAGIGNFTLEVGCGHGHFLAAFAAEFPEEICIGIDLKAKRLARARRERKRRERSDLLFMRAEALEFLTALPDGTSISRTFLLFSDPWPKRRHHKHRVIQRVFLDRLAEKTVLGGRLHFRTDHASYFDWAVKLVTGHPRWVIERGAAWPLEESSRFQQMAGSYDSFTAVRLADRSCL